MPEFSERIRRLGQLGQGWSRRRYTHTTLPPNSLRLLKVVADKPKLTVVLETFHYENLPKYDAISYVWGKLPPSESILCNGSRYKVTPALFNCLEEIYRSFDVEWLWVDAICIHQTDDVEKAAQVAQIWSTFSKAERVLIWLGQAVIEEDVEYYGETNTDATMDFIRGLNQKVADLSLINRQSLESLGLPNFKNVIWTNINFIFHNKWFRRLWTVQEAVLAKTSMFLCGSKTVTWEQLSHAGNVLQMLRFRLFLQQADVPDVSRHNPGTNTVKSVDLIRANGLPIPYRKLPIILDLIRHKEASVPVDRVYAVLGILPDHVRRQVNVDYSPVARSNYWRLYVEFQKIIISSGFGLASLGWTSRQELAGLPSWCPNLNSLARSKDFTRTSPKAGGSSQWPPILANIGSLACIPDCDRIQASGLVVETVAEVVDLQSRVSFEPQTSDAQHVLDRIEECVKTARRSSQNPPFSLVALARTLVGCYNNVNATKFDDATLQTSFPAFHKQLERSASGEDPRWLTTEENEETSQYRISLRSRWRDSAMFTTRSGRLGLGPDTIKPGDRVFILFRKKAPIIIREVPESQGNLVLGECYVDGLMDGEIFGLRNVEKDGYDEIILI